MIARRTGEQIAHRLRERAKEMLAEADGLEASAKRPLFRRLTTPPHEEVGPSCSVSWGGRGTELAFEDEVVTRAQAMKLAASFFWMCFESERPGDRPDDPETFRRCMDEFTDAASARCHQRRASTSDETRNGRGR